MMRLVAVQGCTIDVVGTQVVPPSEIPPAGVPIFPPTGSWQISTPPSTDSFVDDKGIYRGNCTVIIPIGSVYGITSFVTTTPSSLNFKGSSQYSQIDSMNILLHNESTDPVQVVFTEPSSGTTMTVSLVATITNPNQTSTSVD